MTTTKSPPPANLRYPFGRAIPTNFRWKGKFTEYDEQQWREHCEAMQRIHDNWTSDPRNWRRPG